MASRSEQPIISSTIILLASILLLVLRTASDLHSPLLFLLKAGVFYLSTFALIASVALVIWRRSWLSGITLIIALAIHFPFLLPTLGADHKILDSKLTTNSTHLSVATFSAMTRTQNTDDILRFIKSRQPEIFCIQEVPEPDRRFLLEQLDGYYPYWKQNQNNQITLSKYPLSLLEDVGQYQAMTLSHPLLGDIQLVNVHMPRPYRTQNVSQTWQDFLALVEERSASILCGDFNITPDNTLYDVLTQRLEFSDALTRGYGFTYPNSQRKSAIFGPLIRIDYLFSRDLRASQTETINISNLSDHRAVLSYFPVKGTSQ